jgi:hypothetical protein
MIMFVTVEVKVSGGISCITPYCENAKMFAKIAKTNVLHRDSLDTIRKLGFDIIVKQQEKFV